MNIFGGNEIAVDGIMRVLDVEEDSFFVVFRAVLPGDLRNLILGETTEFRCDEDFCSFLNLRQAVQGGVR